MSASTIIKKDQPNEPEYKKLDNKVKFSFTITYILLVTTGAIAFIEAMRTNNPNVRHILNLETCISLVAGYFYFLFIEKITKSEEQMANMDWSELSQIRYMDWSITTPFMLIVLCLVLSTNIKKTVSLATISSVVLLNYAMLYFGYLGEMKTISIFMAEVLGFGAFSAMFYIIYNKYVKPTTNTANRVIFGINFAIWTMYGVAYLFNEEYKNIMMNILDLFAKCFMGIGLWVYYTKIITA
jgi:bacteriorhodopsin